MAKTAADLLEWSQHNRERMREIVGREIQAQLHTVGVAPQNELDALKKRVRELERAAGMTASGRKKATGARKTAASGKAPGRKSSSPKRTSPKTTAQKTTAEPRLPTARLSQPAPVAPGVTRRRLDAEMVRRGLAASRAEAQDAVRAGLVLVRGTPATKAATMVAEDEPVALSAPPRRFVSRGGEKLQAALDRFDLDPSGLDCLDAGASTGGFTDCLLRAGARRVVAVDVGYGQLAWDLRNDDRVTVMERTNVRDLHAGDLPFAPQLVVADLSLHPACGLVLNALVRVSAPDAAFLVLVKPQFEAGQADVGHGGVVRDPAVWRRVLGGWPAPFERRRGAPMGVWSHP